MSARVNRGSPWARSGHRDCHAQEYRQQDFHGERAAPKAKRKTKVKRGDDGKGGTDGQQPASAGHGTGKANDVKTKAAKIKSTRTNTKLKNVKDQCRQY